MPGSSCRPSTLGRGIRSDLRGRLPLYWSDWLSTDGSRCSGAGTSIIASATLFSYISSVLPAVVIGDLLFASTDGQLGLPEVLLSTGATGIIWALFGGQPLCIIGVTMPVAIFVSVCYILAQELSAPFLPWLGWICVLSGIMHMMLAVSGGVRFVHMTTAFSCEIFGFFISVTYIWDALVALFTPILQGTGLEQAPLGANLDSYRARESSAAFANLCLAIGTYVVCMSLHQAQTWRLFYPRWRVLLSDYAAPLAIILFTGLSYIPEVKRAVGNARLAVPDEVGFIPSFPRSWLNPLLPNSEASITAASAVATYNVTENPNEPTRELEGWHIALAILPAIMLTALFFFDHNVSSKLAQDSKYNLKKPSAYHWDFSVLGLEVLLVGLVGVPPGNGLIPQAPLHTRALATITLQPREGGGHTEVFSHVVETRWSNLLQSVAVLCTVFALPALAIIPQGCLDGVFLFLGMAGFAGNDLWERAWLLFQKKEMRRPAHAGSGVRFRKIRSYTIIQLGFVVCVFVLAKLPFVAVAFPLLIAVLIPVRLYLLPKFYSPEELHNLDPDPPEMPDEHPPRRTQPPTPKVSASGAPAARTVSGSHAASPDSSPVVASPVVDGRPGDREASVEVV
jgi:hypothetical protein